MKFEIERDKLLKIKHENYSLYQMIMALKSDDTEKDYCETLDKAKLAKECELGYFKIDELFTRKQIQDASYFQQISEIKANAGGHVGLMSMLQLLPKKSIVQTKYSKMVERIKSGEIPFGVKIDRNFIEIQELLFSLDFAWVTSGKEVIETNSKYLCAYDNNRLSLVSLSYFGIKEIYDPSTNTFGEVKQ